MKYEVSTNITRPLTDVFQFVTRFENQNRWQAATVRNNQITPGAMRVGVQGRHVGRWLGRSYESIAEVIEFEPQSLWGYRSVSGPYDLAMHYRFEPVEDGTRLSMTAEADAKGFFGIGKLTEPLVGILAKRLLQGDLERLKRVLETA